MLSNDAPSANPPGPEPLDVAHESEGPRPRQLFAEVASLEVVDIGLPADDLAVEVDLDLDLPAVVRTKLGDRATRLDPDRLQHLYVTTPRRLADHADLLDRIDERFRAAVHDRHFVTVDLDLDVVDAEAADGGQQVLDRGDLAGTGVAEHGRQRGGHHVGMRRGHFGIQAGVRIGLAEHDA